MARFAFRIPFPLLALAALAACGEPAGSRQSAAAGAVPQGPPALPAAPASCPAPTNDVTLDMELGLPLLYGGGLGIFNVYWGEDWDSIPGNFQRADIERALNDVIATPYFDRLCQYGVPPFSFEGGATSGGFLYPCASSPGATTNTPALLEYMSCAEYAPGTGVPLSGGLPNPLSCGPCGTGIPLDCFVDPVCLVTPNPTGNRVYVVLLPKGTVIDDFGSVSCAPGSYSAYHFQIPSRALFAPALPPVIPGTQGRPINMAIIPTECFGSLAALIAGITHEVVEAATDPLPLVHWIDESVVTRGGSIDITKIPSLFKESEAADICQTLGFSHTDFTAPDGTFISVAPYWSNADNACVSLDVTPPVSSAALSPAANANGWNNTDVTATLTATDAGAPSSGVKEIDFSAAGAQTIGPTAVPGDAASVVFTAEGVSVLAFHAVDNAGNVEADQTRTVRIDKTPPVVGFSGNAGTYTVDQDVAITCAASDALSGVASTTCADLSGPAWSFGLGAHTLTASATDRAGNVGSASTTFTVEVTFASLCSLTRGFSPNPAIAEALCRWLDRAAGALCCEEVEVALEKYRQKIGPHVPRVFTSAQAGTLGDLADALRPAGCDLRADACHRLGRGP